MYSSERLLSSPDLSPVPSPVPLTEEACSTDFMPPGVVSQDISDMGKKICASIDESIEMKGLVGELCKEIDGDKKMLEESQKTGKKRDEMKKIIAEKEMIKKEMGEQIRERIAEHESLTKLMCAAVDKINYIPVRKEASVVPVDQQPPSSSSPGSSQKRAKKVNTRLETRTSKKTKMAKNDNPSSTSFAKKKRGI